MNEQDTRIIRDAWHHGHDYTHAIPGADIVDRLTAQRIREDDPEYTPDAFDR